MKDISQLKNKTADNGLTPAGRLSAGEWNTLIEAVEEVQGAFVTPEDMEAAVSQFITCTVNDLTNYYLKSETYTQAEVQALIEAMLNAALANFVQIASLAAVATSGNYDDLNAKPDIPVERGSGRNSVQQKGTGAAALGANATAEGNKPTALGDNSHAEGNSSNGNHPVAINPSSTIEEVKQAWGQKLFALAKGKNAHIEGSNCLALQNHTHAEGDRCVSGGYASHSQGQGTETTNGAEHAEGSFNKSNPNTRHSVGIGTSESDRKNAHEIMRNGDMYVYGVGGYDGTNAGESDVMSLQQILLKINELVDWDQRLW